MKTRASSPTSRCFSSFSTTASINTKTYKYGCTNLKDRLQLSILKPRQSAEIEDELYSKINSTSSVSEDGSEDGREGRLVDPILNKPISRNGLDWIKSVSVPSSLVITIDRSSTTNDNGIDESDYSITITLQPPTLLHPRLDELSSNVAQVVQEEIVSLISNNQQRYTTLFSSDIEMSMVRPDQVGVKVIISPQSTAQSSQHSSATLKSFTSQQQQTKVSKALQNIKHFIAVYSCKGGVGKSTIATNLAYQLSNMGGKIGLLDVDVYGPSLPLLVKPEDVTVRQSPTDDKSSASNDNDTSIDMIEPIIHNNVKLMSLGYVSPTSGVPGSGINSTSATVLRGPMAGRVVSQLLKGTNWGNLDILVLDLPPGTGDVQLEICQSIQLSGAVAVSTPSKLAWSDVMKGVSMFGQLNVRTLCVVENMSYFECEGGGRHYPFGKAKALGDNVDYKHSEDDESSGGSLAEHYLPASSHVFHLPISSRVNDANDSGMPLCCVDDDDDTMEEEGGEERATFAKLANAISTDLLLLQHNQTPLSSRSSQQTDSSGRKKAVLTVSITEAGEDTEFDVPFTQLSVDNESRNFTVRLFSNDGGYQKVVSGRELRCRDPRTGEVDETLAKVSSVPQSGGGCGSTTSTPSASSMVQHHTASIGFTDQHDDLFPVNLTKKGNYGYEVEWKDGSKIIYSLLSIAMAAGGKAR